MSPDNEGLWAMRTMRVVWAIKSGPPMKNYFLSIALDRHRLSSGLAGERRTEGGGVGKNLIKMVARRFSFLASSVASSPSLAA